MSDRERGTWILLGFGLIAISVGAIGGFWMGLATLAGLVGVLVLLAGINA